MLTPDVAEVVELYSMVLGFSRTGAHRSPGIPFNIWSLYPGYSG